MKHFRLPLFVLVLLASSHIYSQTTYYTAHPGSWSDSTAWSTIGIDSAACACSPGCSSLAGIAYIGNTMVSINCLSGIGPNAAVNINSGDTLTITVTGIGGKLPVTSSKINVQSGGVMIVNGELDITAGDTINNAGILTVNGNVTDTNSGAYLAGGGSFTATGAVSGTTIFISSSLWVPVTDTNAHDTGKTSIVYTGGNVGIGTTNPAYALEVNGIIAADSSLIVGGADSGKGITLNGITGTITSPTQAVSFGNDTIKTTGTIESGNIITNDITLRDTMTVPVIRTHRVGLFPGDSLIHFGDSSIIMNLNNKPVG